MTITFLGSLIFCLVFLAIVHFLHDAIKAEKLREAAINSGIAILLLVVAWIAGSGTLAKIG